ncbi:MAG: YeiH family protein [Peptoniphilus sp.]|nr:YeiH family protein [Peptoniphilus sp.]MDD7362682.1 YeiH family protein [Bacillota bacterium]MDY6044919.1 YeiH family protein [Peptoniphilus sp.]
MHFFKENWKGLLACLAIAVPSWLLGKQFPIVGGPVISILVGMIVTLFWKEKGGAASGIKFTSKYILQAAVVFLGFGMNLSVIMQTGKQSLPIIISTIAVSLIVAYLLHRAMNIPSKTATLVGVGSSICGGSAIAATAPVIEADDDEVAQAIAVIFFFNVLAAIFFPMFGSALGFSTASGESFGIFAGTAINDTSSVTAAAATWDSMYGLGTATLDKAVTVKLTRTLAIIPITLVLAGIRTSRAKKSGGEGNKVSIKKIFPWFVLFFLLASIFTTVLIAGGVSTDAFAPVKDLSKFLIVMAMGAIGLNSNIVKLIKTGGKPLVLGACCWAAITGVSLLMQHVMGIW